MKRLILLLLLGVIATANGFTRDNSLLARVTVYWARGGHGADRYTRQHKSATGLRLQQGHCAVDPKRFLMAVGSFFLMGVLYPPSTPVAPSEIAKLLADRGGPFTNATRS